MKNIKSIVRKAQKALGYKNLIKSLTLIRNFYQQPESAASSSLKIWAWKNILKEDSFGIMNRLINSYLSIIKKSGLQPFTIELYNQVVADVPNAMFPVVLPGGGRALYPLESEIGHAMFYGGGFEPNELYFVNTVLKPGDNFIDIGANAGLFSIVAATKVAPEGHIFAFEPDDSQRELYQYNMTLNNFKNYTVFDMAVSSQCGTTEFVMSQDGALSSFKKTNHIAQKLKTTKQVTTTTLDKIKEELGAKAIRFIKIDVEGAELDVLKGGTTFLSLEKDAPIILCEFCDDTLSAFNTNGQQVFQFFTSYGYTMLSLPPPQFHHSHLPLDQLKVAEDKKEYIYENLVAFKPSLSN